MREETINQLIAFKEMSSANVLYQYGVEPQLLETNTAKNIKYKEFIKNYDSNVKFEEAKGKVLKEWLEKYLKIVFTECEYTCNSIDSITSNGNGNGTPLNLALEKHPLCEISHNNILYDISKEVKGKFDEIKSMGKDEYITFRSGIMNRINPKFILRNHIAQRVIEKAEKGDYMELEKVLEIMTNPFEENENMEILFKGEYDASECLAYDICVSCSS